MSFNAYTRVSETSMPVNEVEEWLDAFPHKRCENKPNGGIIMSTECVMFIDGAAKRKDKRDYQRSLKELAKQQKEEQAAIAKKIKEWTAAEEPKALSNIETRHKALVERLTAGERIPTLASTDDFNAYHEQRRDMKALSEQVGGIIKVRKVKDMTAVYMVDNLSTYDGVNLSGKTRHDDIIDLVATLRSGEMVTPDNFDSRIKQTSATIKRLSASGDLDICTVFDIHSKLKGWVVL